MLTHLLIATVLAASAQSTGRVSPTSDASNSRVTATGSSTPRALKDIAADISTAQVGVARSQLPAVAPSSPGIPVSGAIHARAVALRSIMRSRGTFGGTAAVGPSGMGYAGLWLRDYVHMARPFPGYFTSARIRTVVDKFAGAIGGEAANPAYPPEHFDVAGTASFRAGGAGAASTLPIFDSAPYLALLVAMAHDRGDSTVYSTHLSAVETALAAAPRDASGRIYSAPAGFTTGWGFEDSMVLTGGLGMATALHAWAYAELQRVALDASDPASANRLRIRRDALVAALRTMRRADGYYSASTDDDKPHAILTALVVAKGLCSTREAVASSGVLARDYRLGLLTQRGAMRHLVWPNYYAQTGAGVGVDTYQNGAYWLGEWVAWLARSVALTAPALAAAVMQEATDEVLRQHRVDGQGPWEWQFGTSRASTNLYAAGGAFLSDAEEAAPTTIDVQLDGANGSYAIVQVPSGHSITAAEVVAAASTLTVSVSGAARTSALGDTVFSPGFSFGAEAPILAVSLAAATAGSARAGATPVAVFGGYVKVAISSGSSTGKVGVRLFTAPAPPLLYGTPTTSSDDFAMNRLAERYERTGVWTVSSGRLRTTDATDGIRCIFTGLVASDIQIAATVNVGAVPTKRPGFFLRYVDAQNYIWLRVMGTQIDVFQVVAGVQSQCGTSITGLTAITAGADTPISAKVEGTTVSVTYNGTTYTRTTSLAGAGAAGFYSGGSGSSEIAYDDAVITALSALPAQPIPPGRVLEYGGTTGIVTGESFAAATGTTNLLDAQTGAIEATATGNVAGMRY